MFKLSPHYGTTLSAIFVCCALGTSAAWAAPVSGQGTWEDTLSARVLSNGQTGSPDAYYDSALDITWLADTRLSSTLTLGVSGITADGRMDWTTAQTWLTALNASHYLGYSDWRLPATFDFGTPPYTPAPSSSEMAHLYYTTLGNPDYWHGPVQNTGPFADLPGIYWSTEVDDSYIHYAKYFNMYWGNQQDEQQYATINVMVVRSGDTPEVPIPASFVLFLTGLFPLGMAAFKRRK